MRRILALPILLAAGLLPILLQAQQRVDIQLHRADDGAMEVLLLPSEDFDGVLSSIVFTLACGGPSSDAPSFSQTPAEALLLPIAQSGPDLMQGDIAHRRFAGIGLTPMSEAGARLQAGKSYRIGRFEGMATGSLVDAAWLKNRRNNGAYYISLNGLDVTGVVIATGAPADAPGDALRIELAPNPYTGGRLSYVLRSAQAGTALVTMTDEQGKAVEEWRLSVQAGSAAGVLDARPHAPGAYQIKVAMADAQATSTLVIAER